MEKEGASSTAKKRRRALQPVDPATLSTPALPPASNPSSSSWEVFRLNAALDFDRMKAEEFKLALEEAKQWCNAELFKKDQALTTSRMEFEGLARKQEERFQRSQTEIQTLKKKQNELKLALFEMRKGKATSEDSLSEHKTDSDRKLRELELALSESEQMRDAHKNQCDTLQQQLASESSQLKRARKELASFQQMKDNLVVARRKVKELENRLELAKAQASHSFRDVKEENDRDRLLRALKSENATLREKTKDYELNYETLRDLQGKQGKSDELKIEVVRLRAQHEPMKRECGEWRELASSLLGEGKSEEAGGEGKEEVVYGVAELRSLVQDLRQQILLSKANEGVMQSSLTQLKTELGHTREDHEVVKAEAKLSEKRLTQLQRQLEASKKQLQVERKSGESCKRILDHYEKDTPESAKDSARAARTKTLETTNQQLKEMLNEKGEIIIELERAIKKLEKLLAKTEQEAASMEHKLGRGEFDHRTTKVLHFAMNPEKKAATKKKQDKEKALEKEKADLLVKVTDLEEKLRVAQAASNAAGGKADKTPGGAMTEAEKLEIEGVRKDAKRSAAEVVRLQGEVARLQRSLGDTEKDLSRLKQVFREKVGQFREACYRLTGYKIDMSSKDNVNVFTLRSLYAENEGDYLMFHDTDKGLEVIETAMCRSLPSATLDFLKKWDSIPSFLSEITNHLFSKQTHVPRGSGR